VSDITPGDLIIASSDWYVHPQVILHETTHEWGDAYDWTDCTHHEPGIVVSALRDFHWDYEIDDDDDNTIDHNVAPIAYVVFSGTIGWMYADRISPVERTR
jgi:hypothetical protein